MGLLWEVKVDQAISGNFSLIAGHEIDWNVKVTTQ